MSHSRHTGEAAQVLVALIDRAVAQRESVRGWGVSRFRKYQARSIHRSYSSPEAVMRKALCLALIVVASAISGGCYVMQDANGQWWACEEYQTPNGPLQACTPIQI